MMRPILIAVLATAVIATIPADAASRHKHKRHHAAAPIAARAAPVPLNRPVWGSPYECYTDEGYGRFWPCGAGKD